MQTERSSSPIQASRVVRVLQIEHHGPDAMDSRRLLHEVTGIRPVIDRAENLAKALKILQHKQYDVILLDIMLADSQGLQTLDRVYACAPITPIIVLTRFEDEYASQNAINQGAEDYLIKSETDGRLLGRAIRYAMDRKKAQLRLEALAQTDTLTGLLNRNSLEDRLRQSMLRAERSYHIIGLLFIDLDLFKHVNDEHGHQIGDTVLKITAQRLTTAVRQEDSVARIGGDEFVVILQDVQSEAMAMSVAKKIIASIEKPMRLAGRDIRVTASIGIDLYTGKDVSTPDKLLNRADRAMYTAKHDGRNAIKTFMPDVPVPLALATTSQWDFELRQALTNQEFFIEYQPLIDIRSGYVVGAEALLRWAHPQRGVVPPGDFIELLESNGLIISVGEWVLRTACEQWADWLRTNKIRNNMKISVNLSPRQCQQANFAERLGRILADVSLSPWLLDLELTESMLLEHSVRNIRLMAELKKMGVNLTLDDFGTGFSSLSYLRHFPIDRLKVDQSFVKNILHNRADEAIAVAIISLANNLGLEVVAEGVDRQEKIDVLCMHGCDVFQGFHLGRPMRPQDFLVHCSRH